MKYIIILILLFFLEQVYFKIADKFNIIDKPNERSSHNIITLRGGGIIFFISVLIFFIDSGFAYPFFFIGLSLMTIISFLDDILTLSNKIRLTIHFLSVGLMVFELNAFSLPWYYLLLTFIIVVGVINAYNFMDGINGITASYSFVISLLLWIVNYEVKFINEEFLIYTMLGILVFGFFNFRSKAKTFAGDVGSVSIAFILLFAIGLLILKTENIIYILFLCVYGVDSIMTIIRRLFLGENIFKAHRSHLYQYLGNEGKINKLLISALYGFVQFIIGILVILVAKYDFKIQMGFSIILLFILSIFYLSFKSYVIKKYVH